MKSLRLVLLLAFVMCLAFGMVIPSASAAPAEQTPSDLCNCVATYQQTVYQAQQLDSCQKARGSECLGAEVRIVKSWAYNAARNACVGSYEVWNGVKSNSPQWGVVLRAIDMEVDLATARKRCDAIGVKFATTVPSAVPPSPTVIKPTNTPTVARPTDTSLPPSPTVAKPTLTPTNIRVVAKTITLDPQAKAFIASSPTLDQATKAILNQDSAIIARDNDNNFYAITNQGKVIPLPTALRPMLQFSFNFSILGSELLLSSSEHSVIRGSINGGGEFVYLNKIPSEMKDKDYVAFATTCSLTKASVPLAALAPSLLSQEIDQCRPEMKVNSTATSIKVAGAALGGSENPNVGSSEHSVIRGEINGGGDFIFDPPMITLASYTQQTQKPFIGVQYELNDRGALVKLVVANSPAAKAGLMIGDIIQKVDGKTVNAQQTLAAAIQSHAVGDTLRLDVWRANQPITLTLRLGALGPAVIYTPSATIYPGNATLAIDIGFNGFTGVYVINGKARVGDVDLASGDAVIVAPMNKVSKPIKLTTSDVNPWWDAPQTQATVPPPSTATPDSKVAPTSAATPDRTPTPNNDLTTAITNALLVGGSVLLCGLGLFGAGAVFWMMRRS